MLYEFFIMQLSKINIQTKYKQTITIEVFKKNIGIEKKYPLTADIKRFILEKTKKQINKHSDIKINYELIKTGRSFTHIAFTAERKKPKTNIENNTKTIEYKSPLIKSSSNVKQHKTITSEHKESAKKHINLLKKNLGIKNKI